MQQEAAKPTAFQFTPLREGRRGTVYPPANFNFNSRPSARGDASGFLIAFRLPYFNSRPSARGDGSFARLIQHPEHFNSRPSARGDANRRSIGSFIFLFQFTPLREGRREALQAPINRVHISIHAPPRGATLLMPQALHFRLISIHAPPRGATLHKRLIVSALHISIHAPPRGATCGRILPGCVF